MAFEVADEGVVVKGEVADCVCQLGFPQSAFDLGLLFSGGVSLRTVFLCGGVDHVRLCMREPRQMAPVFFAVESLAVFAELAVV